MLRAGTGAGPLGVAYVKGLPQAINDLPQFSGKGAKYIERLSQAPWNLDAELIRRMGRKARAFLSIPISMSGSNGESGEKGKTKQDATDITPEGIVCLDVKNPLSQVTIDELTEIGEILALSFGTEVACLWRLRK